MVTVDSGMEDDEDDGGGLSRWYKQTDIASEMSQRTLNSIIEDADLSDPQLLELVLLLDSLARWQFHAPCNNRQQHVDALLLEVRLLDAALVFWSQEGKESAYWVPGDHAPEIMADARDGPYLRRAVSRVGLLQRYQGQARLDACRSMMETTKKHVQRIYTSWDRGDGGWRVVRLLVSSGPVRHAGRPRLVGTQEHHRAVLRPGTARRLHGERGRPAGGQTTGDPGALFCKTSGAGGPLRSRGCRRDSSNAASERND